MHQLEPLKIIGTSWTYRELLAYVFKLFLNILSFLSELNMRLKIMLECYVKDNIGTRTE
jgi:hypothetical protein